MYRYTITLLLILFTGTDSSSQTYLDSLPIDPISNKISFTGSVTLEKSLSLVDVFNKADEWKTSHYNYKLIESTEKDRSSFRFSFDSWMTVQIGSGNALSNAGFIKYHGELTCYNDSIQYSFTDFIHYKKKTNDKNAAGYGPCEKLTHPPVSTEEFWNQTFNGFLRQLEFRIRKDIYSLDKYMNPDKVIPGAQVFEKSEPSTIKLNKKYNTIVYMTDGSKKIKGILHQLRDSSIVVSKGKQQKAQGDQESSRMEIPISDIESITIAKGAGSGIAIGAVIGLAISLPVSVVLGTSEGSWYPVIDESTVIFGTLLGTTLGAFIGGAIASSPNEQITIRGQHYRYKNQRSILEKYSIRARQY